MKKQHFRRDRLPLAVDALALLSIELGRANRAGYALVRCPIHGESHPSLSIHLARGNWRCFACGEHGGDVLELYRRARRITFKEAARELGAWDDMP